MSKCRCEWSCATISVTMSASMHVSTLSATGVLYVSCKVVSGSELEVGGFVKFVGKWSEGPFV